MWTRFESWAGKAAASGSRTHERAFGTLISALLLLGCLGGCVFSWLERDLELQRYELNRAVYESLSNSTDFEYCNEPEFQKLGYCKQHDELEEQLRLFLENAGNSLTDRYQWTWIGSTFFVFHLSSTVGYATEGAPLSNGGKFFAVLFGAVGIPLFGCLLLVTSSRVLRAARSLLSPLLCCLGGSLESSGRAANGGGGGWRAPEMLRLAFILVVLLWLGAAVFFSYVEGWSYARSIFFCFVTFSTVGIGTDVPETLVGRAASVLYVFLTLSLSLGIYRSVGRRRKEALGLPPLGAGSGTAIEQSLRSKPAAICFGVVLLFAAVGGWVLSSYERPYELRRYVRAASIYEGLNELSEFSGCDDEFIKGMEFCRNVPIFRKHLHTYFGPNTPNSMVDKHHWTGFGAASFVLSLASTIGYGAQTPHTHEGKVITVVVGIFVIPLFWYCMLVWGDAFRSVVEGFAQPTLEIVPAISITPLSSSTAPAATTSSNEGCSSNSSNNNNNNNNNKNNINSNTPAEGPPPSTSKPAAEAATVIGSSQFRAPNAMRRSISSLVGAVVVLWILGSIVLFWLEGWDPATAIYFCFVTLTAVGLESVTPKTALGRIFLFVYISFGLTSVASLLEVCIDSLAATLGIPGPAEEEGGDDREVDEETTPLLKSCLPIPVTTTAPAAAKAESV